MMNSRAPGAVRLRFRHRLKTGKDFSDVRSRGLRMVHGCLIANWLLLPAASVSRVGVITSKKVGGAVVRNRARRIIRESYRKNQMRLALALDLVLVARPSIRDKGFQEVEQDFLSILNKAGLLNAAPAKAAAEGNKF